jgi:Protein of unknown function (DUF2924)
VDAELSQTCGGLRGLVALIRPAILRPPHSVRNRIDRGRSYRKCYRSRQVGGDRSIGLCRVRAEAKLNQLIEEEDRRVKGKLPVRKGERLITGTRLIREWQGVEHTATVLDDGFEYQGRRTSRSRQLPAPSPARAGTGRPSSACEIGARGEGANSQDPLRHLHPRLHR